MASRHPLARASLLFLCFCMVITSTSFPSQVARGQYAPPTNFLYLPFRTTQGDWLTLMTSAFDHHFPDYTCSLGPVKKAQCEEYGKEIAIWEGEIARPVDGKCYGVAQILTTCGYVSGYQGVTGDSQIYYDGHDGYDWAIPEGTNAAILAAASGEVVSVKNDGSYGWTVTIDHHNGYQTLYSHLQENVNNPHEGTVVNVGDTIGMQGSSGKSTGLHLHFRVLHNGNVTDPFGWCASCVDPSPDPLMQFNGETSQNLWYGTNPRSVGDPPSRSNIALIWGAFDTEYLGGPGVLSPNDLVEPPLTDNATFTGVENPPDTYAPTPGAGVHKTWAMRNSGTTTWGPGYRLAFVGGRQMGAPNSVSVPNAAPGQTVTLALDVVAPSEPGVFRGYWQLQNPQGTFFGERLWVQLTVGGGQEPLPSGITVGVDLKCVDCPTQVGPGQQFRPTFRATVNSGQLQGVDLRGDMLRHKSGELYGAHLLVAVPGRTVVNPGQTWDFTFYADNPVTAPSTPGVYESVWQIWRAGDWDGPEVRLRFEVIQGSGGNRPPNAPSQVDPHDWALYTGPSRVTLRAQHNGDPDGDAVNQYFFEIFDSVQTNSGWIGGNSWSVDLSKYGRYQWRVKVKDARGAESGWSPTWNFSLQTNEPQISAFSWQWCHEPWGNPEQMCFCAETNAGTIRLQVNSATDGSDRGTWQVLNELGSSNWRCTSDSDRPPTWTQLEYESGRHLVRLYARRDISWDSAASRDLIIDLSTNRRPNSPSVKIPGWDTFVNDRTVLFDWIDTWRTTSYRLQVATDEGLTNLLINQAFPAGVTQYQHTFDQDYPNLYGRVIASGPYGENTGGIRFKIDRTAPTSSVSPLPAATYDAKFTVQWQGSDTQSGLKWYHVQVRDGNRPDAQWQDWLVNTTKQAEIFTGMEGHTYYFRARAMDKIGNWEPWPAGDGDTATRVDPTAAPSEPWWNAAYQFKRRLVVLNNDVDAMPPHFPVLLHFDGSTSPTAAEIYNASLASTKGNDVRVVFNNQTELNRTVTQFSPAAIDIWFPVQGWIGGGQSDSTSYTLYFGNAAAGQPPSDVNSVFVPEADGNTMGLWHFQEGSGGSVADSSGRGHHGTFSNPGWDIGTLGQAGSFNGANSTVTVGNHPDIDNISAYTLEAWVKLARPGWGMILDKGVNGSEQYAMRITGDSGVECGHAADGGNQSVTSNRSLQVGVWYHVACVSDGDRNHWVFISNSVAGHNSNSRPPLARSYPLYIGNAPYWSGMAFGGQIAHVRVSNAARTNFPYAGLDVPPAVAAGIVVNPPVQGSADLAVVSVRALPSADGSRFVEAVVRNQGNVATGNGFYTDLYLDHLPTGANDVTGSIRVWVNAPIAAGAEVTLTAQLPPPVVAADVTDPNAAPPETTTTVYLQTDTAGVVKEQDKANNITAQGIEVCTAAQDTYEADDSPETAKAIGVGQSQWHNFHDPADQDWVTVSLTAGKTYEVSTADLGTSADTYVYVYSAANDLIAANDDTPDSLRSSVVFKAAASGTYRIMVRHWNPNILGCGTSYTLRVSEAKQAQTITFPPIPDKALGSPPFEAGATASSGLPVSLSSITPTVCSVSGSTVTLLAVGTCTIRATQAGNEQYDPAPTVEVSFNVLPSEVIPPETVTGQVFLAMVAGPHDRWASSDLTLNAAMPLSDGDPNGYIWEEDGTQHVVYRGIDDHVHELSMQEGAGWRHTDVVQLTAAPLAVGNPVGYVWEDTGTQHVIYRGADNHIHELWNQGGSGSGWNSKDLTTRTGAPAAAGDPAAFVSQNTNSQHILYRGADNHLHELWLTSGGNWQYRNVTQTAAAPAAAGDPSAHVWDESGTQHVVYRGADNHIHELWRVSGDWQYKDLTARTSAPLAASDPAGHVWKQGTSQHIIYRGQDNHVYELSLVLGEQWQYGDLTQRASAPVAAGDPIGYTWAASANRYVAYRGTDDHIHQLGHQQGSGDTWAHVDLTARTGAPSTAGNPAGYGWPVDSSQHIVYRDPTGHIHELIYK